jgi:hypothetical protein
MERCDDTVCTEGEQLKRRDVSVCTEGEQKERCDNNVSSIGSLRSSMAAALTAANLDL